VGTGGRCQEHRKVEQKRYDADRGTSAQRGYGAAHRAWREQVLARDPVCVDPYAVHAKAGRDEPATVADHIVPVRRGGRWTLDNGQGLCASCHGMKNVREDGRWASRAG
jgi:5-methylcytosine-specific restriction protein A